MNKKSSTVIGDIEMKLIDEFSVELSSPLTNIINSIFETKQDQGSTARPGYNCTLPNHPYCHYNHHHSKMFIITKIMTKTDAESFNELHQQET